MTFFGERTRRGITTEVADKMAPKSADQKRTLKDLKIGDVAHIVDFLADDDAVKKIEAMGLRRGKTVAILQKLGRGIVVKTSNSRIVITTDIAKNIEVK